MIVLSGTIGAGKTSLTKELAQELGTTPFYEPVGDNPVLPLFYADPKKYGFLLQIYFLNRRFDAIKRAMADDNNILDRSIYEDLLFTQLNADMGRITQTELGVYKSLLDNMMKELPYAAHKKSPDLLVHIELSLDEQLHRIAKRGREYEQLTTDPSLYEYYSRLHNAYEKWYNDYNYSPKMKINGDMFDFVENPNDRDTVLAMIEAELSDIR